MGGDDLFGRKLGEFVLRGRIGEGGFGAVYWCEQPLLGREAVVKVLHAKHRENAIKVKRFVREARVAARLDHPFAVHVYAFGIEEHDRLLWLAMERVHGVTLAEWLVTHGPMSLGRFASFFDRVAAVVQAAHDRGVIHRDLKPSNIMVIERAGQLLPKLLDFGVAKLLDPRLLEDMPDIDYLALTTPDTVERIEVSAARSAGPSTITGNSVWQTDGELTQDNETVGSPPYMSPEQWDSAAKAGPASDLYALAVIAFEALTGHPLFRARTVADYNQLHCFGEVPALGDDFPVELSRTLQRALAKRPQDRFSTALELGTALQMASGRGLRDQVSHDRA